MDTHEFIITRPSKDVWQQNRSRRAWLYEDTMLGSTAKLSVYLTLIVVIKDWFDHSQPSKNLLPPTSSPKLIPRQVFPVLVGNKKLSSLLCSEIQSVHQQHLQLIKLHPVQLLIATHSSVLGEPTMGTI